MARPFVRTAFLLAALLLAAWLARAAPPVEPRRDLHGDTLPKDAVLRLGSIRFRGEFALAPVGKLMAALRGNAVRYVDPETGAERRRLPGPDAREFEAWTFLVAPHGEWVAYGGLGRIEVWDVATSTRRFVFQRPGSQPKNDDEVDMRPIAFTPDGARLIARVQAGATATVCWNMQDGSIAWFTNQDRQSLDSFDPVGLAAEGSQIVAFKSKRRDYQLVLMDLVTGSVERTLYTIGNVNQPVAFVSPDGSQLILALPNADRLRRFELPGGRELTAIVTHTGEVRAGACSPDNRRLAVMDAFCTRIFDAHTLSEKGVVYDRFQHDRDAGRLLFSADSKTLWINNPDGSSWRPVDSASRRDRELPDIGHRKQVEALAVSSDGTTIATGSRQEPVRHWNAANGKAKGKLTTQFGVATLLGVEEEDGVTALAFSSNGKILAGACTDNRIALWDLATGRRFRSIETENQSAAGTIAFSPDNRTIAVPSGSREQEAAGVNLFDVTNGQRTAQLEDLNSPPSTLAFSADGRLLAAVCSQVDDAAGLQVWDVASRHVVRGVTDDISSAVFLPHGESIAFTTPADIVIWELRSGGKRLTIPHPKDEVIDVLAVSRDGRTIAGINAGAGTRRVYLWDVATGTALEPLVGHDHHLTALAFLRDGRLVTGSKDGTALVWDLTSRITALSRTTMPISNAWEQLLEDAPAAHRAIEGLVNAGPSAVRMLRANLRPAVPLNRKRVETLLARLDAPRFADRQKAAHELEGFDLQAVPFVRAFASTTPSAEARRLAERYLARLTGANVPIERLRELRALEVLERLAVPEARTLLSELAAGDSAARLTMAAQATLARLAQ